jgi:hypothetical protein
MAEKLRLISEALIRDFDVGSPLSAILEATSDLNLLTAQLIRLGIKVNEDATIVKILDKPGDPLTYEATPLMNVKSLRFKVDNPIITNPDLAEYFDELAEINIQILRNPTFNPYMGLKERESKKSKLNHQQYEYYRRRRKSRKSSRVDSKR